MKLLLEGLVVALVLLAELVGLVALATRYTTTTTTTEARPSESRGSLAIVASGADGGAYRQVEWDAASCEAWGVQRNSSDRSGTEANSSFSEAEAQEECRIRIRPHLATPRQPGVRPTDGHRPKPATSESTPSTYTGE